MNLPFRHRLCWDWEPGFPHAGDTFSQPLPGRGAGDGWGELSELRWGCASHLEEGRGPGPMQLALRLRWPPEGSVHKAKAEPGWQGLGPLAETQGLTLEGALPGQRNAS